MITLDFNFKKINDMALRNNGPTLRTKRITMTAKTKIMIRIEDKNWIKKNNNNINALFKKNSQFKGIPLQQLRNNLDDNFTDNVVASWYGPHYCSFSGHRYPLCPQGWAIIAKSHVVDFEIQGDHGTFRGYEGGTTWNTKLAMKLGQTVFYFDSQTSEFKSTSPINWHKTAEELRTLNGSTVALIKSKNSQIYLVHKRNCYIEFYFIKTQLNSRPDFFAKIIVDYSRNLGIICVSLTVPRFHASEFIDDALVPSLSSEKKGNIVIPERKLYEDIRLTEVECSFFPHHQQGLVFIKDLNAQLQAFAMHNCFENDEIKAIELVIENTPENYRGVVLLFIQRIVSQHKNIQTKERKVKIEEKNPILSEIKKEKEEFKTKTAEQRAAYNDEEFLKKCFWKIRSHYQQNGFQVVMIKFVQSFHFTLSLAHTLQ